MSLETPADKMLTFSKAKNTLTALMGFLPKIFISLPLVLSILVSSAVAQDQRQSPSVTPLTNKDVIEMVKSGVSTEAIIAKIKASPCDFDFDPSTLSELIVARVPDEILKLMGDLSDKGECKPTEAESEIPTVTYCDLLLNPDSYNGKLIRLKAIYETSFERSALDDPACHDPYSPVSTWADFDVSYRSNTKKEVLETFEAIMSQRDDRGGFKDGKSEALFVGRFYVSSSLKVEGVIHTEGYGHLGRYKYLFVIKSIEEVHALK